MFVSDWTEPTSSTMLGTLATLHGGEGGRDFPAVPTRNGAQNMTTNHQTDVAKSPYGNPVAVCACGWQGDAWKIAALGAIAAYDKALADARDHLVRSVAELTVITPAATPSPLEEMAMRTELTRQARKSNSEYVRTMRERRWETC